MTQQILSWFTPTGLRPVPYFTVRISTKNRSTDQFIQSCSPQEHLCTLQKTPCWTYSSNWHLYRVHCKAQNNPCWSPQQVPPHTESTVRKNTSAPCRKHPAEPTAVTGAYTESTVKPRTTLADPLSKSHNTQNPLCATRPLLNPSVSHTLYRIHCTDQNYQSRQFKQNPKQHDFRIQMVSITNALLYSTDLQNRNERRSKKAYSVRFNQQNSISNQN